MTDHTENPSSNGQPSEEPIHRPADMYRVFYDSMSEGAGLYEIIYDAAGEAVDYWIRDVNAAYTTILGLQREEIIDRRASEIYPAEKPHFLDIYAQVAATGQSTTFEAFFPPLRKHLSISVFSPGKGQFATTFYDISERKQAEEALRENEHLLASVLDLVPVGICLTDAEGRYTLVNNTYCEVYDFNKDEIIGQHFSVIMPPDQLELAQAHYAKLLAGNTGIPVERKRQRKDGTVIWIEAANAVLIHRDGRRSIITVVRDVTPRKQAEDVLHRERDLLDRVTQTSPVGITVTDSAGHITFANDQAEHVLGLTKNEITTRDYNAPAWRITDYAGNPFPEGDLPFARVKATGQPVNNVRHAIEWPDGKRVLLSINAAPLLDEAGNFEGMVSTVTNVTAAVESEVALKESQQMLQDILNTIPVQVFWKDRESVYLGCNRQFALDAGLESTGAVVGKTDFDLSFVKQADFYQADDRQVIETGIPRLEAEEVQERSDGKRYWVQTSKVPLRDAKGHIMGVLGVYANITQRKQTEEALRESETRYRAVTELISDFAYSYKRLPDGSWQPDWITEDSFTRLTGYDWREIASIFKMYHPDDVPRVQQHVEATHQGKPTEGEYRIITEKGETHWVYVRRQPIWDGQTLLRYYAVAQDITERKQAETFLQRRDAILQGVSSAAEIFLKTTDWRQDIDAILAILGQAALVDRVTIFEKATAADGRLVTNLCYVWAAEGIKSHRDDPRLQNVDYMQIGYVSFHRRLEQRGCIHGHTRNMPPKEREGHRIWGIQSLINVPIIIQDELWGTISFHTVRAEREWLPTEIEALQAVADMLGTVIEREEAQKALRRYTERLAVLREVDRSILAAESPKAIAEAALHHVRRLVDCSQASVATFDFEQHQSTLLAIHSNSKSQLTSGDVISLELVKSGSDVLRVDEAYVVNDLHTKPELSKLEEQLRQDGIRTYVSIPLHYQDNLIGLLSLARNIPNAFLPEEIEIASELADQLAIAIQQARLHEQIHQHAAELEQRVRERTAELEAANTQLRALSQAKDEFVSNVSHELRTPITSLNLRQDLLAAQPQNLAHHLAALRRETNRLARIIDDLLQLSRLDQGRTDLELIPVDLNNLVQEYVTDRTPVAQEKGLKLSFTSLPNLPIVEADRNLLGQVLSVLLTNALNYTPRGGEVIVSTQMRQHAGQRWVGFRVKDTGPGILPEEKAELFTRFFRGSVGYQSEVSGTGLGLAIAAEIIARHHGEIEVESTGISGEGATFTVWVA